MKILLPLFLFLSTISNSSAALAFMPLEEAVQIIRNSDLPSFLSDAADKDAVLSSINFLEKTMMPKINRIQTRQELNKFSTLFMVLNLKIILLAKQNHLGQRDCGRMHARNGLRSLPEYIAAQTFIKAALQRHQALSTIPVSTFSSMQVYAASTTMRVGLLKHPEEEYASFVYDSSTLGLTNVSAPVIFSQGHHAHLLVNDGMVVPDFGILVEDREGSPMTEIYYGAFGEFPFTVSPRKIRIFEEQPAQNYSFAHTHPAPSANVPEDYSPELVQLLPDIIMSPEVERIFGNFDAFCRSFDAQISANKKSAFVSFYSNEAERLGFLAQQQLDSINLPMLESSREEIINAMRIEEYRQTEALIEERNHLVEKEWESRRHQVVNGTIANKPSKKNGKPPRGRGTDHLRASENSSLEKVLIMQEIDEKIFKGRIKYRKINKFLKQIGRRYFPNQSREKGSHIQIVGDVGEKTKTLVKPHGHKGATMPMSYLKIFSQSAHEHENH
jgi:hypothetical protein